MNIPEAVSYLKLEIKDPTQGLPEEVFLFTTSITPMVNVDLLIRDQHGRILLSWREDEYCGTGWHLMGGIVRLKEKMIDRVYKVIEKEVKSSVWMNKIPIAYNEVIFNENILRGHFISFLYDGFLNSNTPLNNENLQEGDVGYLKWFFECPNDLLKFHEMYKKYFAKC